MSLHRLRQRSIPPTPSSTAPPGPGPSHLTPSKRQPISLNDLFASASPAASPALAPAIPLQPQARAPTSHNNPLDALFAAAAASPNMAPSQQPLLNPLQQYQQSQQPKSNPLDALFATASASPANVPSPAPAGSLRLPSHPQQPQGGMPAALEQLFASASPTPMAAILPGQKEQQKKGLDLLSSMFESVRQVRPFFFSFFFVSLHEGRC